MYMYCDCNYSVTVLENDSLSIGFLIYSNAALYIFYIDRCYSVYYHGLGGPPDQDSGSLGVDPQTRTLRIFRGGPPDQASGSLGVDPQTRTLVL